uniref:Uncharacterized protein n=1 Tax=virus sp. ct9pU4 TaxID=2828248 RepID=A0A8S5RBG8_9VIRU|nr:MAG TPA: hypothetical protein [virus sp. ct9pU4]
MIQINTKLLATLLGVLGMSNDRFVSSISNNV